MNSKRFRIQNLQEFKSKALKWAALFDTACVFDSNNYPDPYSEFDFLVAAGVKNNIAGMPCMAVETQDFASLQRYLDSNPGWSFGFLSYDLKNELEDLNSENEDHLNFPLLYFFSPQYLLILKGMEVEIIAPVPDEIFKMIGQQEPTWNEPGFDGTISSRFTREEYVNTILQIKKHIQRGDIYEVNFCQEFYSESAKFDPVAAYYSLNQLSPSPFSSFFKNDNRYIISATPERFLSKKKGKLISQPIKGTAKRGKSKEEDDLIILNLKNDTKEKAENVMIVDLVRNDMTRGALPGTVRVEELFGIYSFGQVHQMISTVVCDADPSHSATELIKPLFPMGSMTGAPKLSAMQLIEKYERSKRGVFSGAIGYFSPNGDFDFNVVIRSILYSSTKNYLSFQAGSAITYESDPGKEYEECLIKVGAIKKILSS